MIVKNEAAVIRRCLASVRPFIDAWAISDTGSSDGTQAIIRETLADLPGELIERPWVDFAHNRNEALDLARGFGDYSLVLDADEILAPDRGFVLPVLDADVYRSPHRGARSDVVFDRVVLVRNALPWRYVGVLHETLVCPEEKTNKRIDGLLCIYHHDGARSAVGQTVKFRRDAEVLERALEAEPDNARYVFYLAQSYRDAGDTRKAIEVYHRRRAMGGWPEEVWFSLYQIGLLHLHLGETAEGVYALLSAFQFRPSRAEPLCNLAAHHRGRNEWELAHLYASRAMTIPEPSDRLFVTTSAHRWRPADEASIAAYYLGRYRECYDLCVDLLSGGALPDDHRPRVEANRDFATRRLGEAAGAGK